MSQETERPTSHPQTITGGCLCGSIRYSLDFTKATWPPQSATCQCTMCRKWTSSLFPQFIVLRPSQITPQLSTLPMYKEYQSSAKRFRGFCGNCGSSLIWRSDENVETFDLFLGTIDEEWLVGEKLEGSAHESEFGIVYQRKRGFGKEIGTPNQFQFYCENVIEGVTDVLRGGKMFLKEEMDGKALC